LNSDSVPQTPAAKPRIIPRSEHPISRRAISPNALRVLYRLKEGGFEGFLVGGCVRDLLLGHEPKDFDVATNALPEQVKRLFRNCRLVGRRFRLAHVFYGREIIEVATFRAASAPPPGEDPLPDEDSDEAAQLALGEGNPAGDIDGDDDDDIDDEGMDGPADEEGGPPLDANGDVNGNVDFDRGRPPRGNFDEEGDPGRVLDSSGRILRDNNYGSIEDDVWRRDFTANSLYYNVNDFSLWDYCGGADDIAARRLKLIGDPETRYREDPVRMLRAARFEAKLGFTLDPATEAPIAGLRELLARVPAARLFDETLKLFLTGHGARSYAVLRRRRLLEVLYPTVDEYFVRHPGSLVEQLLSKGLENTDARVLADRPVTPTFLFALLLYGPIAAQIEATPPERWHEAATILTACDAALREAQDRISIPRRFALGVREMFALQPRLEHPRGKRALRTLEHPRFRAAYDLLLLRAQLGMAAPDTANWWTRVQDVSADERLRMVEALDQSHPGEPQRSGGSGRPRRRRGGRRRSSGSA
jgi:poly(A) polymerase